MVIIKCSGSHYTTPKLKVHVPFGGEEKFTVMSNVNVPFNGEAKIIHVIVLRNVRM